MLVGLAMTVPLAYLARSALLELHRVDSLMTNWTDISEVARLNREATAGPVPVQPEVADVLRTAARSWQSLGATARVRPLSSRPW